MIVEKLHALLVSLEPAEVEIVLQGLRYVADADLIRRERSDMAAVMHRELSKSLEELRGVIHEEE